MIDFDYDQNAKLQSLINYEKFVARALAVRALLGAHQTFYLKSIFVSFWQNARWTWIVIMFYSQLF